MVSQDNPCRYRRESLSTGHTAYDQIFGSLINLLQLVHVAEYRRSYISCIGLLH